jgi:hypothetical protein
MSACFIAATRKCPRFSCPTPETGARERAGCVSVARESARRVRQRAARFAEAR